MSENPEPDGHKGGDDEDGVIADGLVDPHPGIGRSDQPDQEKDDEHRRKLNEQVERIDRPSG